MATSTARRSSPASPLSSAGPDLRRWWDGTTVHRLDDATVLAELGREITGLQALSERVVTVRTGDDAGFVLDARDGGLEELPGSALLSSGTRWAAFARPQFGSEGTVTFVDLTTADTQQFADDEASLHPFDIEGDHAVLFDIVESDAAVVNLATGAFADVGPARSVGLSPDGTRLHISEPGPPDDDPAFSVSPADDPGDRTQLGLGIAIAEWF